MANVGKDRFEDIRVDPCGLACNRGWEGILQSMFPRIEQFSTKTKHWRLVEDYYRVRYWLAMWANGEI
jgi:hypothetical protein